MKLDRELQNSIISKLVDCYPDPVDDVQLSQWMQNPDFFGNLRYLMEHDLVRATADRYIDGTPYVHSVQATAAGVDFLAGDGGLSAVLGVVTVKLHDDTIKQLIELKIRSSDLPAEEKSRLSERLKKLPSEALEKLTAKVLEVGIDKGFDLITDLF